MPLVSNNKLYVKYAYLYLSHPTVSAKALCFQAVHPPRLLVRTYCYHDISWTACAILMKLTGNIH